MDRKNERLQKTLYKCIMANTSAIWQQAAYINILSTNYHLTAAHQKPYNLQKGLFLNEQCWRIFWKKSGEWTIT